MHEGRRFGLVCAAGLALANACSDTPPPPPIATSSAAITAAPTPTINNFVVYASNNVTLGTGDHSVGGNIGVATANGTSPQLVVSAQDGLDLGHTLYAPAISVGSFSQVGAVDTNSLTNNGGQVGTQSGYPSSMPPVPSIFSPTPGPTNITVAAGNQETLPPGSYGALADNGIVFLSPGTYSFASVTLGNNAQLQALQGGSTSVLVGGALSIGSQAHVSAGGLPASALTISVSATDGTNGSPPAVAVGTGSQIVALLAAPNGTVSFANNVQATGAFAGLNFSAGTNVTLNFQSGFANALPAVTTFVAYAELSMTLGSGDHTLGGDVGVGAVGASSVGTQLTVGSQDQLDLTHTVYGPSVSLGSQAIVGDIDANALTNNGGQFAAQAPYPSAAMPLEPLALTGAAGTTNITVSQGQQQTLTPGPYGTLTDDGVVLLQPGAYSFVSVALGNNAQLQALPGGATSLGISGTFSTGTFAQIFPLNQAAGALTINVAGNDGMNGSPPAASLGSNTQVIGLLNAPNGTLSLSANVQGTGAFAGFNLVAGNNVTLTFQSGFPPASAQPSGSQQLTGYTTGPLIGAPLVGPVPSSTQISISVALPVQVPTSGPYAGMTLSQVAQAVSDPTNTMYRQYISDADYATYYSPTAQSYSALQSFVQASGFTVSNTYSDHELIDVYGTVGQLNQMLFLNLNYYQRPDGTSFFAPDRSPSLMLSEPVLQVAGTNNSVLFAPASSCSFSSSAQHGHGPNNDLLAPDLRVAYLSGCSEALTGAGQSIGLIEGEGFSIDDLEYYIQLSNAAAAPADRFTLNTISEYSFLPGSAYEFVANLIGQPQTISPVGATEAPLDVEMAWAMAPGAQLVIYQAPHVNQFAYNMPDAFLHKIANPDSNVPRVHQVSSSWQFAYDNSLQQSLTSMAAHGQSFFESSGDGGSLVYSGATGGFTVSGFNGPDFRFSNDLTLVGGTALTQFGPTTSRLEETWNQSPHSSGGGYWGPMPGQIFDMGFPLPGYQKSAATNYNTLTGMGSTGYRNFPDVSMVAQNLAVIETIGPNAPYPNPAANGVQGSCPGNATACANVENTQVGTSAAAPLWAGIMALANEAAASNGVATVGFANPILYAMASTSLYATTFNDITLGCNPPASLGSWGSNSWEGDPGNSSQLSAQEAAGDPTTGFIAIPGYDLTTGLGTPTCALITQLASLTPTVPVAPPAPSTLSFAGIGVSDSCGILDGTCQCWGNNANGQDGNNTTSAQLTPVCVQGLPGGSSVKQVAEGSAHSCALLSDGSVWCWGDNTWGQLGEASMGGYSPVAVQVLDVAGVTQISAGAYTTCAVMAQTVVCWGLQPGSSGNTGAPGGLQASDVPLPVSGLPSIGQVTVSTLGGFACAIGSGTSAGEVYCWGDDEYGELGDVLTTSRETAAPVDVPGPVISISAGATHACAANDDGETWCWGDNSDGQYGNGGSLATFGNPVPPTLANTLPDYAGFASVVACGAGFTCVVVPAPFTAAATNPSAPPLTVVPGPGEVACFGANTSGQLGNQSTTSSLTPVIVSGITNAIGIEAGPSRVCALLQNGTLSCWGAGPIGNGGNASANATSPVPVLFSRCP
jgi:alpha-tubulin suppressor-like RCC1 family protein